MRLSTLVCALPFTITACVHADVKSLPQTSAIAVSSSTAEAGEVSIDIASLNQWQDIAAHFQPNYNLTGKDAVALVNRASTYENGAFVESSGGGLGVQANGSILANDKSRTTTSTTDASGSTTSTSTSTTAKDSKQSTPESAPNSASPASTATANQFSNQVPNLAPIVNYQSADALFKYAAVLDQGFGNMAPSSCWVPVLVTFRITVSANKRNQPYDTVVDLSLFSRKSNTGESLSPPDTNSCLDTPEDDVSIVSFSSDSLENGQSDILAQQTKALALAAALRAGVVATSANFQSLASALDHNLFLRPNSLVSVARAGDNTLHIRLGANRFGANDYEMLSLDHQVSIVLLVPFQAIKNRDTLRAVAHYYFDDARGPLPGVVRPTKDEDSVWLTSRAEYLQQVSQNELNSYPDAGKIETLVTCAAELNRCEGLARLAERLAEIPPRDFDIALFGKEQLSPAESDLSDDLRARIAKYATTPGIATASRVLPISLRVCPDSDVTFPVIDDGKDAVATVTGADGFQGAHITAKLIVWTDGSKQSTSVAQGFDVASADIGDLRFPSVLKRFKSGAKIKGELYFLGRDGLQCPGTGVNNYSIAYLAVPKKPAEATPKKPKLAKPAPPRSNKQPKQGNGRS